MMVSTIGVVVTLSWPRRAAGPARRRATAASNGPKRCISTGRRVGAPAAGGRDVDFDLVAAAELAHQDLLAERILHELLDRPLERTRPVVLVVPLLHQELEGALGELDLVAQPPLHLLEEDGDDLA